MRIRPFFYLLLALSCASILTFAALLHTDAPASSQVHLDQHPTTNQITLLSLRLTDTQGLPIEQAQVISHANMTTMDMGEHLWSMQAAGQGNYHARLQFPMAGPWVVTILIHAEGFAPLHQILSVNVSQV